MSYISSHIQISKGEKSVNTTLLPELCQEHNVDRRMAHSSHKQQFLIGTQRFVDYLVWNRTTLETGAICLSRRFVFILIIVNNEHKPNLIFKITLLSQHFKQIIRLEPSILPNYAGTWKYCIERNWRQQLFTWASFWK